MKAIQCLWLSCAMVLASCVHYDAEPFNGKTLPRITGYLTGVSNDWLYINLRTGEVFNRYMPGSDIKEGEQHHRLDWDVAFCGYRLRTNSGTSGEGQGEQPIWAMATTISGNMWRSCRPVCNGLSTTIRCRLPIRATIGTSISSPIILTSTRILGLTPTTGQPH